MKKLYVVGIGPGDEKFLTKEAQAALERVNCIFGYTVYVELVAKYLPDKEYVSTPMMKERERCILALKKADEGNEVAMVCSGDSVVYGMAGLILELNKDYPEVEVEVVAGITSALSGSAVLGAPLTTDFAVISLSDLLTPKELIGKRLEAAAMGDFVICIYNPSSKKRKDYLNWACSLILKYKPENTPCGVVKNIGRDGEEKELLTLGELKNYDADMFTTIFIGSRDTFISGGRLVTKRGYRNDR